ncbi:MAG: FeoB-associated Cys-rich membrane protein [Oscillospiraceae bacterium]
MKYVIIAICILLIVLAIFIFVRAIIKMSKGKCCENCKHCSVKEKCHVQNKENDEIL